MSLYTVLLLGILQGLTEFLPVSSSGHLVIAQYLMPNFSQPGILFDTILHFGTLFSVLVYFKKKLFKLSYQYLKALFIGSIPAVIVGIILNDLIALAFTSIKLVGLALVFTAVMNYFVDLGDSRKARKHGLNQALSLLSAIWVGIAQALAVIPGISRSGATIFAGVKSGMSKKRAAEFSFLLSVPAVLGANFLQLTKYGLSNEILSFNYFVGFLAAFVSGYFGINVVFSFLKKAKFKVFSYYLLVLSILILLF
jgi:undecaprenyl-diphosphatase